ncbi:Extracellular matrix FRAS1 [Brachionus plicatilis]|uniref:Extracellular matrix FRAS1 n=1 Tax=Brachionus plicatilis TaxID=10195 RepID=A0A3M7SIZ5_BRAPC|nr:Extracellular matrix FRAS1 [Brachionus plicatilis]
MVTNNSFWFTILKSKARTKLSSFPLVDLIDGFSIRYVQSDHKNKEPTMDSFMFHVSDGINESPTHKIAINIKIINDEKPVAVFEPLQVQDGKGTILTNSSFFIVDFDSTPENIRIEVEKFPKYEYYKLFSILQNS